jgi:L-rhamnose mutarotase
MKRTYNLLYLFVLLFLISGCIHQQNQNPSVLEMIDTDYRFSTKSLIEFCTKNKIDQSSVYEYQNHWIIFSQYGGLDKIKNKLEMEFPKLIVKLYDQPFYNFNRQKRCNQKQADEWDHTIMTANLVEDTVMQNQYMEYHRTQFEKWPEVSNGFCNAGFQQVLVFRNGRQLMLIISIPRGENLDKLNPKTTENNPRVDEWNTIMSKYQEGIEDAPKGSVWVKFDKLN